MQYLNTLEARFGSWTPWALSPDAKPLPQWFWWASKVYKCLIIMQVVYKWQIERLLSDTKVGALAEKQCQGVIFVFNQQLEKNIGSKITLSLNKRSPIPYYHMKYIVDLSLVKSINIHDSLITNPNPTHPVTYRNRTYQILHVIYSYSWTDYMRTAQPGTSDEKKPEQAGAELCQAQHSLS